MSIQTECPTCRLTGFRKQVVKLSRPTPTRELLTLLTTYLLRLLSLQAYAETKNHPKPLGDNWAGRFKASMKTAGGFGDTRDHPLCPSFEKTVCAACSVRFKRDVKSGAWKPPGRQAQGRRIHLLHRSYRWKTMSMQKCRMPHPKQRATNAENRPYELQSILLMSFVDMVAYQGYVIH